ncbi:MAG: trypsin-like peptidase domain-containing protein [Gemmatimonadaceae bacterium]|nr:trypsin-like peptidase domain-containing protein [Gloeobacterales cyanobacterium ES-bin-141]
MMNPHGDTFAGAFALVAERLRRSTVQVRTGSSGRGSGVIWRPDGLIVTNAHVAGRARATVELSDGRAFEAVVVARDPERDLAALTVPACDLPAAVRGDAEKLRVGELVLAVGYPLGLDGALTVGIVHALDSRKWVQADVRLAPGNSGGPLADAAGRVIGINTMIANGLGLAVPSNVVEQFLGASQERPYLGVTMRPVPVSLGGRRLLGLVLLEVATGSRAEAVGLLMGDVLIGVGGRFFETPEDLTRTLRNAAPGTRMRLELMRGGRRTGCDVVIGDTGAQAA